MATLVKIDYLPENITLIRNELNLTQEQFADVIGATKAKVYNFEKGKTSPKAKFLDSIAELGGIPAESLKTRKLSAKDLKLKVSKNIDGKTIKLLAEIKAQNTVILKNQSVILGGKSKTKVLEVFTGFEKDVENELQLILADLKTH